MHGMEWNENKYLVDLNREFVISVHCNVLHCIVCHFRAISKWNMQASEHHSRGKSLLLLSFRWFQCHWSSKHPPPPLLLFSRLIPWICLSIFFTLILILLFSVPVSECVCIFFIIVVIFLMNSTEQTNQFWSHRFIRRFINLLLLLLLPSLLFFCCSLTVHSPKTLIDNLHSRLCERTRMNGMERNRMECQAGGWTWKYEVKILYNYVNLILSIRFFRTSS